MALLESLQLPLGTPIIPFSLRGTDGNYYSELSFQQCANLVIVFTCNHCPYAQATEPYLLELSRKYDSTDVGFVFINPNDAEQYPDDSYEAMQERAVEKQYNFPYVQDETQAVAKAYQAQCTPDVYVFGEQRTLQYHGRVNNVRVADDTATTHELDDALQALLQKKPINPDQKPSMGCSIKWKQC